MTVLRLAALGLLTLAAALPAAAQNMPRQPTASESFCRSAEEQRAHALTLNRTGLALDCRAVFDIVTENDHYVGATDQWYTSGQRFGYLHPEQLQQDLPWGVRQLDEALEGLGFFGPANSRWGINIGQYIYTPIDVVRSNPDPRDHPYGGYAHIDFNLVRRTGNYQDRFLVQAGMFGPGSWARRSQDVVHAFLGQDVSHGWKYQIRQEYSLGLGWDRTWRYPITPGRLPLGLEIDALPSVAVMLSNVWVYGQLGGRLRFGEGLDRDLGPSRLRPAVSDGPSGIRGEGFGWYVFGGLAGRAVGRDMAIEGNTFKESRGLERMNGVMDFDVGAAVIVPLWGRAARLSYTQDWRTQEFVGQKRWFHYGSFNLSFAW